MPTLYIHAGMPKTGTTALQSFLKNNRVLISEKCRLYYPETGIKGTRHIQLFPIKNWLQHWELLGAEIMAQQHKDIILSEENITHRDFSCLEGQQLENIKQILPGYHIKIIIYIRKIDDYMRSVFNEAQKGLFAESFSYKEYFFTTYTKKAQCLFASTLIRTAIGFVGKENVLLRIYDKKLLKNGNIIDDFFDLLGKEIPEDCVSPSNTNPSLPNATLPFLSKSLLPLPRGPQRNEIVNLIRTAYTLPKGSGVGDEYLTEFQEEIERVDAYLPGYKDLFKDRPLSFSFSEVDVKDPHALFVTALLYRILIRQQAQEEAGEKAAKRLEALDTHFTALDKRLASFDKHFAALDKRLSTLEAKALVQKKKMRKVENALQEVLYLLRPHFPNGLQKFFLALYSPFLKFATSSKYHRQFKNTPNNFFADTKHPVNKAFLKFLELFGPKAVRR